MPRFVPVVSTRYADRPMGLVACPFCREMFESGEKKSCPVCGMELVAFETLSPSHDALGEEIPVEPHHEPLPWNFLGRGRLTLPVVALLGLVMFFLPWVHVRFPDTIDINGFDMARRLGWSSSAGCAWVVLIPTVLSRRSIWQMRGARVAAAFLSAVPGVTTFILWMRPPHGSMYSIHFDYGFAFYATMALSAVALVLSVQLGGRLDDIKVTRGTSKGELLH
jgi:hypothetical protein